MPIPGLEVEEIPGLELDVPISSERNRPDTPMFAYDEPWWEKMRTNIVDKIAMSPLPESMKPGMAQLSQAFMESPRVMSEWFSDPASVVTPGLLRGASLLKGPTKPIVVPKRDPFLLPAGDLTDPNIPRFSVNDPYIAGPAGLQRESLVSANPQEAARLQGFDPLAPGTPAQPSGSVLDIGEAREAQRLRDTFFTEHELRGGTSLEVPDSVRMALPPTAGDTRLGFAGATRDAGGDLPYPLNVVPESVRPRSAQTVTRALAGDVPESTIPGFVPEKIEFESPKIPGTPVTPTRDLRGGTAAIRPGETILPSRRDTVEAGGDVVLQNPSPNNIRRMESQGYTRGETLSDGTVVMRYGKSVNPITKQKAIEATKQAKANSGLDLNPEAVNVVPPEIKGPMAQLIEHEATTPSPWRSVYTTLKSLSSELYRRAVRAVHTERQYGAQWIPPLKDAIEKLSKTERANFGAYVEGIAKSPSANVDNAIAVWRQIENEIGDEAMSRGLRMFADDRKPVPFQKNTKNYWPHIPTDEVNSTTLVDRLIKSGMSRYEANRVARHHQKTGELVIGAQHARKPGANLPYKLDADAGLQHIRSMSKRIAQNIEFGPLDIKGKGAEGIADLIEATPNRILAETLMERVIGRETKGDERLNKLLDYSRKYAAATKLKNFTIPNMILGQQNTALLASRHPISAIKEVMNLFSKRYRQNLEKSGIWQNFNHTLVEEMSRFDPYLIGVGETFNRGIAGAVGRSVAREALRDLKSNPSNKQAIRELSELVLEPLENLLKQERLTEKQLQMAAARAAEMSQGLNVPGNLPHWASNPVKDVPTFAAQLTWTFKKMGYQATKMVWDSIKADPVRNIPVWLALSQVAGELTGDTKSFLRGLWNQDPAGEISKRGDLWLEGAGITPQAIQEVSNASGVPPQVIARLMDNWTQAFFLGLPADLMMSAGYGPAGLATNLLGPQITDASKYLYHLATGNFKGIGNQMIRDIPLAPGSAELVDQD